MYTMEYIAAFLDSFVYSNLINYQSFIVISFYYKVFHDKKITAQIFKFREESLTKRKGRLSVNEPLFLLYAENLVLSVGFFV